jgi:pimeloyl-ACP methyl ester carboxylesterase
VATAKRAIALANGPVVLVGHSYGGAVISEVGGDAKVASLVYIAAFAPDAGESAASLGASLQPAPMAAELRPDVEGYLKLTEAGVRECFAQDLNATQKTVLYAAQAPTSVSALGGAVSRLAHQAELVPRCDCRPCDST